MDFDIGNYFPEELFTLKNECILSVNFQVIYSVIEIESLEIWA